MGVNREDAAEMGFGIEQFGELIDRLHDRLA
jgi:hypothetical protein